MTQHVPALVGVARPNPGNAVAGLRQWRYAMQGLENVDVPGVAILASGAITIGTMLLAALGWRRRNYEAIERLHEACELAEAAPEERPIDVDFSDCIDQESELSGTRAAGKNDWKCGLVEPDLDDEITQRYILTSEDRNLLKRGLHVRPVPVPRRAAG